MLTLILAEAALELVPKEITKHRSVINHAKRKGKKPHEILLDRSFHHSAMRNLNLSYKRGRPDLVHQSLLMATSSPLYFTGNLKVIVHTINDKIILLSPGVRLPKSYHRFEGLMEKLFKVRRIEYEGKILLELKDGDFKSLIKEISVSKVIGLAEEGERSNFEEVAKKLRNAAVVIGAFPKGTFSDKVKAHLDEVYSIHPLSLETSVVVARIIYEYEKFINLFL